MNATIQRPLLIGAPTTYVFRRETQTELSMRRLASGLLRERIAPMAAAGDDRLAQLRELAEQDRTADDFCLDKVRQLETWRRRLKTVLPVLSTLLGPKRRKPACGRSSVASDLPT